MRNRDKNEQGVGEKSEGGRLKAWALGWSNST